MVHMNIYDRKGHLIDTKDFEDMYKLMEYLEVQEPFNVRLIIDM